MLKTLLASLLLFACTTEAEPIAVTDGWYAVTVETDGDHAPALFEGYVRMTTEPPPYFEDVDGAPATERVELAEDCIDFPLGLSIEPPYQGETFRTPGFSICAEPDRLYGVVGWTDADGVPVTSAVTAVPE